ncbi:MarR family winged helix-turn-helix transcriptional regulator [Tsukamurella spumae]|uniref:Winged helix DNA-binding protein n=1 Tax=Tsukamurella spumae TaxID=44753 RepID=A0A846X0P5_9ACTN|nr:MarR family transcriptional regulator [Tsukamurella spumae]NKY18753.1 winged helix DNA-binding protein [Tsukamurella spumae]
MKPGDAEALRLAVGLLEERLRRLPAAGLRGSELFVLTTVEALGPAAFPTAIGDRLDMKRSNVSAAIAGLRRRGFLQGDADGSDGRRRPVALTDRGRAVLHARDAAQDAWLVDAGGTHLTADEVAQLRGSIPLLLRLAGG